MADYYPPDATRKSRRLYEALAAWAQEVGGVALIGGWAVVELVAPEAALPSRDVDLVFRTPQALKRFQALAPGWRLKPAIDPADRRLLYAHEDDPTGTIVVDVFTTGAWGRSHVPADASLPIKPVPFQEFLPPLRWLLRDKLESVPHRIGKDAYGKQEKDLLDIHRLVFHNRDAVPPLELLADAPRGLRREALNRIERCIKNHPDFAEDYRKIAQWLERS